MEGTGHDIHNVEGMKDHNDHTVEGMNDAQKARRLDKPA